MDTVKVVVLSLFSQDDSNSHVTGRYPTMDDMNKNKF